MFRAQIIITRREFLNSRVVMIEIKGNHAHVCVCVQRATCNFPVLRENVRGREVRAAQRKEVVALEMFSSVRYKRRVCCVHFADPDKRSRARNKFPRRES